MVEIMTDGVQALAKSYLDFLTLFSALECPNTRHYECALRMCTDAAGATAAVTRQKARLDIVKADLLSW